MAPWEEEMGGARVWCVAASAWERRRWEGGGQEGRGMGGGTAAQRMGGLGGGRLGLWGLVGRNKICGPTRPRDGSRPRCKRLTKEILLPYWWMFFLKFQIPKTQPPKERKKQKEYPPTSLLCKPGVTLYPLKKNSTSNSDASIGTTKERLMNQQNSHIKKSSSTSAASAPQAPRILRYAADDTLESGLATQESALARFDGLDSANTSST